METNSGTSSLGEELKLITGLGKEQEHKLKGLCQQVDSRQEPKARLHREETWKSVEKEGTDRTVVPTTNRSQWSKNSAVNPTELSPL